METMKIAQLPPVAMPVKPKEGDSIEQLVSLLTEELVRRGHAVTLFAVGGSVTTAELRSCYERGYRERDEIWDWRVPELLNAARAFEHADEFDVVHSHSYHFALPFTRFVSTPVVHRTTSSSARRCSRGSSAIRRHSWCNLGLPTPRARRLRQRPVIHNGIDFEAFPF